MFPPYDWGRPNVIPPDAFVLNVLLAATRYSQNHKGKIIRWECSMLYAERTGWHRWSEPFAQHSYAETRSVWYQIRKAVLNHTAGAARVYQRRPPFPGPHPLYMLSASVSSVQYIYLLQLQALSLSQFSAVYILTSTPGPQSQSVQCSIYTYFNSRPSASVSSVQYIYFNSKPSPL